jgi:hypothetical protein
MFTGQMRDDVHRGRMLGALLRPGFPVLQDFVAETRSALRQHHPRPLILSLGLVCLTSDSEYIVRSARDDVSRRSAFIWLLSNRNLGWDEACAL